MNLHISSCYLMLCLGGEKVEYLEEIDLNIFIHIVCVTSWVTFSLFPEMIFCNLWQYIEETEEVAMKGLRDNMHILDVIAKELLEKSRITGLVLLMIPMILSYSVMDCTTVICSINSLYAHICLMPLA